MMKIAVEISWCSPSDLKVQSVIHLFMNILNETYTLRVLKKYLNPHLSSYM